MQSLLYRDLLFSMNHAGFFHSLFQDPFGMLHVNFQSVECRGTLTG